jgi:hypothetical protein
MIATLLALTNYTATGNVNPYTDEKGTKEPLIMRSQIKMTLSEISVVTIAKQQVRN